MVKNTIKLKKYSDIIEEYPVATAKTVTPGMLIEMTSTGAIQPHSSAGKFAEKIFALENELEGGNIDTAYAAGDQTQCWVPGRGDQVYAFLADNESASIGSVLESNGAGALQVASVETASGITYPGSVVAVALEAIDTTNSAVATARIAVRIV